jgi:hypothetical protein
MNSFFYIAQKIYKTPNIYYPTDNIFDFYCKSFDESNKPFTIIYHQLYSIIGDIYYKNQQIHNFHKAKFLSFDKIYNNIFSAEKYKEDYLSFFYKIQKVYHAFSRISYIYKYKKTNIQVTNDLSFNPIKKHKTNTITILQCNAKYIFILSDLINIIENAISNTDNFFVEVLEIKNPYNNIPFNLSTLYNIYFKFKESTYNMSILFHLFFLSNFDKTSYALENEAIIREFAIKKFIYNSSTNVLYTKIIKMLRENEYSRKLVIHPKFSKDLIVTIMRPFLYHKYIYLYGLEGIEKTLIYKKILFYKLKKFYEYNPNFGKIITDKDNIFSKILPAITYNTNHVTFHLINIDDINLSLDIPYPSHHYFSDEEDFNSIIIDY